MKVSIIITIYNEEKYLKQCFVSLLDQSWQDFEIIAVNDGSTDNSKLKTQMSKQYFKAQNFRYLEQKHQGLAAARNLGAKNARGNILVFLDGDMYFEIKFLEDLIKPIILDKSKGTFSQEEHVANWDNIWARCWNYNWNMPDKRRIDPKRTDQRKEFRAILKEEFIKVGGLDSVGYTDAWTLSEKLGYQPTATKAKYYHFNPATLIDVFRQAKWAAKREYKLGWVGKYIALIRINPLFSLINGIRKAILKKEPGFIVFKLVFDFASAIGLLGRKKYV